MINDVIKFLSGAYLYISMFFVPLSLHSVISNYYGSRTKGTLFLVAYVLLGCFFYIKHRERKIVKQHEEKNKVHQEIKQMIDDNNYDREKLDKLLNSINNVI